MKSTIIILFLLLNSMYVFHVDNPVTSEKLSSNFGKSDQNSLTKPLPNSVGISADYTPEYIDRLAIIGMPYLFQDISQGSNISLNYYLEANKSYFGFLYGDYLQKEVDLDIWILQKNYSDILNFTDNHDLSEQDILEFTPNNTTEYQIVIWNHVQEESYSYIGFFLVERITGSLFLEAPTITPYNETTNYYTRYAVFLDWSESYTDVNLSVSFDLQQGMEVEASLFYLLTLSDFSLYNPFELSENHNAYDIGIVSSSNDDYLSIPIGTPTPSWISKSGIVIFFRTIQGAGDLELDFSTSDYFDIQFTSPVGVPQYVGSLGSSNYSLFSYYFRNDTKYDIFFFTITGNKSVNSKFNLQIWTGSALEAEKQIQNPLAVPLEYSTLNSERTELYEFIPSVSGRFTIAVVNDINNSSSEVSAILMVFEHWDLTTTSTHSFMVERPDKWNLEEYSLNTFRSFLVPVKSYEKANLTFELEVPSSLEVEIRIFRFTTKLEQIAFSSFSNDGAICYDSGRNVNLDVSSQVGRRNENRVNDTYWIVSIVGVLGKGNVNLRWREVVTIVNWIDYTFAGILIIIALVLVFIIAWKGEQFLS